MYNLKTLLSDGSSQTYALPGVTLKNAQPIDLRYVDHNHSYFMDILMLPRLCYALLVFGSMINATGVYQPVSRKISLIE